MQVRSTQTPPVSLEMLRVLRFIVLKKGTFMVHADGYIRNIGPINLLKSDYGSLEGNTVSFMQTCVAKCQQTHCEHV